MRRPYSILSFVFAIAILCQVSVSRADDAVPVLLWGNSISTNSETSAVNPFLKTTSEEFDETLNGILKTQPPVLVLLKDNLCVEDITQHKEQLQQATSGNNYRFIPAVAQPLSVLKDLSSYNQTNDEDTESLLDGQINFKHIDSIDSITGLCNAIKNNSPNLVVVLTGKSCSYRRFERIKRDTLADNTNTTEFRVKTQRVQFYSSQHLLIKTRDMEKFLPLAIPVPDNFKDHGNGTPSDPLVLHLQFRNIDMHIDKVMLDFLFVKTTPGYLTLKGINCGLQGGSPVLLLTSSEIVFPNTFSYHCSQKTVFRDAEKTIQIDIMNMQVQINLNKFGEEFVFADAYDCIGFTTIPIWTGIFVTTILAVIMIWALTMIMDIRTMDRFDDPKGKTITISAQE